MANVENRCVGEFIGHSEDGSAVRVQKWQEFRTYRTRSGAKSLAGATRLATTGGEVVRVDDAGHYRVVTVAGETSLVFDLAGAP